MQPTRKRNFAPESSDDASSGSYESNKTGSFSDERQCSSSSTVSDADSSAISRYVPRASVHRNRKSRISHSVLREALLGNTGWTDAKHRLYLNSIEEEFIRSLHALHRSAPLTYFQPQYAPTADNNLQKECADSHRAIRAGRSLEHEVQPYSEVAVLSSMKTQNVAKTRIPSPGGNFEANCSSRSSSVCSDAERDIFVNTKQKALDTRYEPIETKSQLSGSPSSFLQPHDSSNTADDISGTINDLNTARRKFSEHKKSYFGKVSR